MDCELSCTSGSGEVLSIWRFGEVGEVTLKPIWRVSSRLPEAGGEVIVKVAPK